MQGSFLIRRTGARDLERTFTTSRTELPVARQDTLKTRVAQGFAGFFLSVILQCPTNLVGGNLDQWPKPMPRQCHGVSRDVTRCTTRLRH